MSKPVLTTKFYITPPGPKVVLRPRLIERLNEGLQGKLILISAPAGSGKTTLVSEWVAGCERPAAVISLDKGDNDPIGFLIYLVAALQTIAVIIGEGLLGVLKSPQPPPVESILTALLNEVAAVPDNFVLILDDYHVIDAGPVDNALTFLLERLPPQMRLVIATREDPLLPLARLRARGQLTELRAADLRFTSSEAAAFLNQMMDLNLSAKDIDALETRTEGWIAGLQLAAISMRGHKDVTSFIKSFTGNHHFVMDYLLKEVLQQQSESVQTFLLRTSILDRMCGPLCDAVLLDPSASGQETLEYLEQANLFIVPLDNERRWYRYHHLFADLLRQRLHQSTASSTGDERGSVAELHMRASAWYENKGLEIEAFHHATAANDVDHATRLITGKGIPLHVRGGLVPVLNWLESLPTTALDERPVLWVMYAGALTTAGQTTGVEQKLQAAEAALQGAELDIETRDLLGRIANNRATLAVSQYQADTAIVQAQRALEYLRPDNLPVRTINTWTLGVAYELKGDRKAAGRAFTEAISISRAIGHTFVTKLATIGLGNVQRSENKLHLAAETFRRALQLFGDQPLPIACEAHLGLARISYEWNDLDAAQHHGEQSIQLARQFADIIDRFVICEVFLARLMLTKGDAAGAAALLSRIDQIVRQHNFVYRMPEVAAAQVLTMLHQGNLAEADRLAHTHELPLSRARVYLAQGDPSAALKVLEPLRRQMEAKGWEDERLKVLVLQAVALHAHGKTDGAVQLLGDALVLAEPGGFIRIFVDEGAPMAHLLSGAAAHGIMPDYVGKLLAVFEADVQKGKEKSYLPPGQPLIEPLSQRELEVLRLIAQGFSNHEICQRLFLALPTVKGHNRNIFGKLQVQRRTEAVARARELGLL
ncbi:MAG: LuxR family transcriptional regulator maltose regulon positive regulatory [Geobacteraceae bacterium]|nr:MAG: LuxR family transcriptional regulator maltose regulon positive regulatory [Geobacteraceae bacterium]